MNKSVPSLSIDLLFSRRSFKEADCKWVTINGNAVCIRDGGSEAKLETAKSSNGKFETGKPVEFVYIHNTEKAPDMGSLYGQDIEPAGRYILEKEYKGSPPPGWIEGTISFDKPLVIPHGESTNDWKKALSESAGGRTGKALTKYLQKQGYDGIVTIDKSGRTSEIISFKTMHSLMAHAESECKWVTINGNAVCIRDRVGEEREKKLAPLNSKTFRKAMTRDFVSKMQQTLLENDYINGKNSNYESKKNEIVQDRERITNEFIDNGSLRKANIPESELERAKIPKTAEPLVPFERWLDYKIQRGGGNPFESTEQARIAYNNEFYDNEKDGRYITYSGFGTFKEGQPLPEEVRKELYGVEMLGRRNREMTLTDEELNEKVERYNRFAALNPDLPEVKKLAELNKRADEWNSEWDKFYKKTPSFFRGTAVAELNEIKKTGTIGGDKNGYNYVAVSADPTIASGFQSGVIMEFDGSAVRKYGEKVEYSALPSVAGVSSSVNYESIDRPMKMDYAHELEARLPEGTKIEDLPLKSIVIRPDYLYRYRPDLFKEPPQYGPGVVDMEKLQAEFGSLTPNIIVQEPRNYDDLVSIYEGTDYDSAAQARLAQFDNQTVQAEKQSVQDKVALDLAMKTIGMK